MTQVTITLDSPAKLLGVFLHRPGDAEPEPLAGVAHSVKRELADGTYHVSVAGTGLQPATPVDITFATEADAETRGGRVGPSGTIALFKQFDLSNGNVR
ncbi:MAG TPA: hypothetical protein VI168_05485 [Croceibacterium sp.]